jgi:tyrosyl-tRNA synthetase
MKPEEKLALIKQVGQEIIEEDELLELLKTKEHPIAYDGFEPSGKAHIAQGLLRTINVNKMIKAGIKFKMYAADWHAWANLKFGGDLEKIQIAGDYLIEVWKACGMDMDQVEFIRASDVVRDPEYWKKVIRIANITTVNRITRCGQIMGRKESEVQQASQILYPVMQCADIFEFDADITQLGMDQRKVNVLAREVAPKLGYKKPIIVSHHMLLGLGTPPDTELSGIERAIEMKMSKSKPDTAIFMDDSQEEVNRKFKKAFCPEKVVHDNPILEYCKYIVFEKIDSFLIERLEKFGGNAEYKSYQELEDAFVKGDIHPADLKSATTKYINELLVPVREYFKNNPKARMLKEQVESYSKK